MNIGDVSRLLRRTGTCVALGLTMGSLTGLAPAQEHEKNRANWPLMEYFSTDFVNQYVYSSALQPHWIDKTDLFWYGWKDSDGVKYWLVDPKKRTKEPLFDHVKMAAQLSIALRKPFEHNCLNFNGAAWVWSTYAPSTASEGLPPLAGLVEFDPKNLHLFSFIMDGRFFRYDRKTQVLTEITEEKKKQEAAKKKEEEEARKAEAEKRKGRVSYGSYSPDGKFYIYAQDHNLFLVEVGKEDQPRQLTTEGTAKFSFGSKHQPQDKYNVETWGVKKAEEKQKEQEQKVVDQQGEVQVLQQGQFFTIVEVVKKDTRPTAPPAPETRSPAQGIWSQDGQTFYINRSDASMVRDLYLVDALAEPRPKLAAYAYPMPGEDLQVTETWVFRLKDRSMKRLRLDKWKDQMVMALTFPTEEISNKMRFLRRDRLQRNMELCEIDLDTNEVKVLISESTEVGFIESPATVGDFKGYLMRYIKPGGDFIWFSERSGWGHYYLYANDGTLKHELTSGPWRAMALVDVDEKAGKIWIQGVGREEGQDPYFIHHYEVSLDGKRIQLLDPGDGNMKTSLSPSKKYAVASLSRPDVAPSAQLLDDQGRVIMDLERTDMSRLLSTGWKFPEMFKVKAGNGITDIYGTMYKPYDFDPKKKYPIILYVYPGPQLEAVTKGFTTNNRNQRLAQLGFIVIEIGNRGGHPYRSNAYHSFGYYNLRDYGLADKKAGVEQLAARYPWIDIDRVGIFGHSGGGFMTAAALLLPPYNEFFKVGVSSAGNHDNNIYNANWAEQHHGLKEVKVKDKDGKETDETKFEIKVPTNAELAKNLKGNLLLIHGDMDSNVHPAGTMRLVNELIKNKKRFDFLLFPGANHSFVGPQKDYYEQVLFEYFSEHLLGDYYRRNAAMGR